MICVDRNLDPKAKDKHKNVVELIQCNFKIGNLNNFSSIGLWLWCLTPLSTIFQLYQWWSVLLVEETGVGVI
jgi:hypothetical protein